MAHYAFIDENYIVVDIIVGKDEGNFDWENYYGNFKGQLCKRTSYNTRGGIHYQPDSDIPSEDQSKALRMNYASIGGKYDPEKDAFIGVQPYPSWVLNENTCLWEPPIPKPNDGKIYYWDEKLLEWVEYTE
jgi:hypothetical protein